ncbi:hypothetical protein [Falsarthrobacter nasiphocae]|uniref:Uncharacterized protein n=1 Tax=Falsarthrobacter nasiphocae TaxID=189863 RepID=A0AAE3YHD9_9MICC|nr:hypothetical protein [Falsarthrobacter nasiphocae]MDR6891973.1 hypothetical protein [Falsarthrobacter nasiphocae]
MDAIGPYVDVLLPSIGIFFIFWFVYRAVLKADRGEREAYREAREEYLAAHPEVHSATKMGDADGGPDKEGRAPSVPE